MIRAVSSEAADIGGPYHGIRSPSGSSSTSRSRSARPCRQRVSSSAGGSWAPAWAPASTRLSACAAALRTALPNSSGDRTASNAWSSVQARWAIWWATVQPSAGVGVAQPAGPRSATSPSRDAPSSARSVRRPGSTPTLVVTRRAYGGPMELSEAIRRRRMVRAFDTERPVPGDAVDALLHSAIRAPSRRLQPGLGLPGAARPPPTASCSGRSRREPGEPDTWLPGMQTRTGADRLPQRQGHLPGPVRRAGQGLDRPLRVALAGALLGRRHRAWPPC